MRVLSIDPSVNNVGWAIFDSGKGHIKKHHKAWKWGTVHPEGDNLEMKITSLQQEMDMLLPNFGQEYDFLVTEKPCFFSSEIGQIAAHQNYTIDLAAVAFYLAGWWHMDHRHHQAITAKTWKGTVPKAVTARRFFRAFPKIEPGSLSEHAIDACMLGRFWLDNYAIYLSQVVLGMSPEDLRRLL